LLDPDKDPGFHVYVFAPVATSVELCPTQITVGVATALTIGRELTVIVIVVVLLQPVADVVPVIV
jgi:hypothetical protein